MTPAGRPALTARGRGLLAGAAGLLVAARLFGSVELAGLGAAAGGAVGLAMVVVGRQPMTYRGERWLAPMRVGVGDPAEVRLRFTNAGRRPTTARAVASDPLGPGGPGARVPGCLVPPLPAGAMAEATYAVETGRRGVVPVGPLAVTVADPFGLVERRVVASRAARLVVHPRIRRVAAIPGVPSIEARHGSTPPARSPIGDDFFALREYEVGDDLRRVHWRSTARTGDLMLRQDELRFGEVATVLLDTRAAVHSEDSFERALEVAASVAAAVLQDGRRLRFLTTGGFDVGLGGARAGGSRGREEAHWAGVLEHLAGVEPDPGGADGLALAVQSIRHYPSGPLAAVVGDASPAELAGLAALRPRLGRVLIARCGPTGDAPGEPVVQSVAGAVVVPIPATDVLPELWNQAVLACSRRDVVRS